MATSLPSGQVLSQDPHSKEGSQERSSGPTSSTPRKLAASRSKAKTLCLSAVFGEKNWTLQYYCSALQWKLEGLLSYEETFACEKQDAWGANLIGLMSLNLSAVCRQGPSSAARGWRLRDLRHWRGDWRNGRDNWGSAKQACEFQRRMLDVERQDKKGLGPIFSSTSHHDSRTWREPWLSSSPKTADTHFDPALLN